jgi:hypothetical protein
MLKCHREFRQKSKSVTAESWGTFVGYFVSQLIAACVLYNETKYQHFFNKWCVLLQIKTCALVGTYTHTQTHTLPQALSFSLRSPSISGKNLFPDSHQFQVSVEREKGVFIAPLPPAVTRSRHEYYMTWPSTVMPQQNSLLRTSERVKNINNNVLNVG